MTKSSRVTLSHFGHRKLAIPMRGVFPGYVTMKKLSQRGQPTHPGIIYAKVEDP